METDPDVIAIALCTLAGRDNFAFIKFEWGISEKSVQSIKQYTNAEIVCDKRIDDYDNIQNGDKIAINFSGGFDSLAARALMPEGILLISLDFGKGFERESGQRPQGLRRKRPDSVREERQSVCFHG